MAFELLIFGFGGNDLKGFMKRIFHLTNLLGLFFYLVFFELNSMNI